VFCVASASAPQAGAAQPVILARLGVDVPTMGIQYWQAGHDWRWSYDNYFSPAVMDDIKNGLHADYVRTGFIPDWLHGERVAWHREDAIMDNACGAGLGVMAIVPVGDDRRGLADLVATVRSFFDRYAVRERGCAIVAEIGNEDNLATTPQAYAGVFNALSPAIRASGVPVVVSGTSGLDERWAGAVARLIDSPPAAGFGFHPYGMKPRAMQDAVAGMAAAIGATSNDAVWITEYGSEDAATLSSAIMTLDTQPAVTVYEYRCQPTDDGCKYGLKDHPALYDAVRSAFAFVRDHRRGPA
jgi:hypothetical protein